MCILLVFVATTDHSRAITVDEGKEYALDIREEISQLEDEKEKYLKYESMANRITNKLLWVGVDKNKYIDEVAYRVLGKTPEQLKDLDIKITELKSNLDNYKKYETMEFIGDYKLTGYCPCYSCSEGWGTKTASGAKATEGITVAADKRKIPLGTKIYIEGIGERVVQDVGGAVKGNKIDIFVNNHQDCYKDCYNMKTQVYIINE